jgi:hypothetical protein
MSPKDRKMLVVAVVLFIIAGVSVWYFQLRTPPSDTATEPAPAEHPTHAMPRQK